jgi:hypothetical protein
MYPMTSFTASGSRITSTPATRAAPASARRTPASTWSTLVLPAPSGPIRPNTSPRDTSKETLETARMRPRR